MITYVELIEFARPAAESLWTLLQSNFSTSVVGSLAGAFGGAWAAQRIAERSKIREELLKEIRNANAASMMLYGVANTHLALKKQYIKRLRDFFQSERANFQLFLDAKKAGRVPTQQVYHFSTDLQALKPPYSPVNQIERIAFGQISSGKETLFVLPVLFGSIQSLNELLEERNTLIRDWRMSDAHISPYAYFGIDDGGGTIDRRYLTLVDGIYLQTDNVIAFSMMLGDALHRYALSRRTEYRKKFGGTGPDVAKMEFLDAKEFLPDPEEFKNFTSMLNGNEPKS